MIHETKDGEFVISSHHVWMPGVYDTRRAANYAFRFPDEILIGLRDKVKPKLITFEMLQEARFIRDKDWNGLARYLMKKQPKEDE